MRKRKAEYKPLLFTTTMRNPERLKDFLTVLSEYDGEVLTNEIIDKVAKTLIQKGLYQPMKISQTVKNKWENEIAERNGFRITNKWGYKIKNRYMRFDRNGRGGIIEIDWVLDLVRI